jgi:hypothetical protein
MAWLRNDVRHFAPVALVVTLLLKLNGSYLRQRKELEKARTEGMMVCRIEQYLPSMWHSLSHVIMVLGDFLRQEAVR